MLHGNKESTDFLSFDLGPKYHQNVRMGRVSLNLGTESRAGEVQLLGQGWRQGGRVGFLLGTAASIVHVLCKADLCSGQRWWIEASVHPTGQQTLKDRV